MGIFRKGASAPARANHDSILCSKHRHARFRAPSLTLLNKDLVDFGVLIFVLNLNPTLLHILSGVLQILVFELETPRFQRQVTGRLPPQD
jgi:hypothetical protein